ncbi:MAG: hypothetical protein ACPGRF_05605, partial [Miltoncostaeaceae bacterium]
MSATRVAVLRFPGTLDHESAARAVEGVGGEPVYAHHEDTALPDGTGAVVIPGGQRKHRGASVVVLVIVVVLDEGDAAAAG